jgi:hypothetical protein
MNRIKLNILWVYFFLFFFLIIAPSIAKAQTTGGPDPIPTTPITIDDVYA